jgi:hypothetical protein
MDFWDGMIAGSRNMIAIGVATGVAGIIIGTVSLTGLHQVIGEFIEFLSGGNLILMLLLVAVMSLILGMGLPTTANYIVVSSLMAPVIVSVGAQSGLVVPLIAVHLFVFYFGILADDTPPVGLAAFAAAAISGGDPIKTGIQGFTYDIRTALLPFLFIFNTELLLIDVTWYKAIFVAIIATIAMLLFAAATQGFWLVRSKWWETVALLLIAFTLFRPGFWLDMVQPPYDERPGVQVIELAAQVSPRASRSGWWCAGLTSTMPTRWPRPPSWRTWATKVTAPSGWKAQACWWCRKATWPSWKSRWPARRSSPGSRCSTSMATRRSRSCALKCPLAGCRRRCSIFPLCCCWGWWSGRSAAAVWSL